MTPIRTHLFRYLLLVTIGCSVILSAKYLGVFEGMDNYCYDLFFRLRGMEEPDRRILIAAIDERTLNGLGRWPLERSHYARLLDVLGAARVVGLDVLMAEPASDDPVLTEAIKRHGRVVLPLSIERPLPDPTLRPGGPPAVPAGHVHLEQDIDGTVRRVFHTLYRDGRLFPSFSSVVGETAGGKPFRHATPAAGSGSRHQDIFQLDGMRINYLGPPGTFPHVSMVDIVEGRYPATFFAGRIVLAGVTADGLEKGVSTPFSQFRRGMSGVETHANILNNLINNNPVGEASENAATVISLVAALAGFLLFFRSGESRLLILWSGGMVAGLALSYGAMALYRFWFSPILFTALLSFMFVLAYLIRLEQAGIRLRAAEREWEDSFNTIDDGIVLVDGSGCVSRMNEAAARMEAPRLLELLDVASERGQAKGGTVSPSTEEIRDPCTGSSFEVKTMHRSGRGAWPDGAVHVIRDVTSARKTEQEKEQLRRQFLQAQKMESMGRLAGGVAHDFNNILTAIIGFSEMALARIGQKHSVSDYLRIVNESGMKAAALVRQLLIFSRKNNVELQVVSIRDIVEDMAKMLGRVIGEDVDLSLDTEGSVNPVLADPGQVEQIVMNLAVNARDAMPQGGTIGIRVADVSLDDSYASSRLDVAPGRYLMLSVSDTGVGMSPEVQARIFEPFYTTKKAGEGTGLGLSTVYGIVSRLAGHIEVSSNPNEGTVFRIYFPVCEAEKEGLARAETDAPVRGTETVLVVEDDESILSLISSTLRPLGYGIMTARSGEEALELTGQNGAGMDLLLTDVVMHGIGGRELADMILGKNPGIRVLFMSGHTDATLVTQGVERGRCHLIRKPLSPKTLSRKVREVLDSD